MIKYIQTAFKSDPSSHLYWVGCLFMHMENLPSISIISLENDSLSIQHDD